MLDGWLYDEKCIARQTWITGNIMPLENIKHFPQIANAIEALNNGEVSQWHERKYTFGWLATIKIYVNYYSDSNLCKIATLNYSMGFSITAAYIPGGPTGG